MVGSLSSARPRSGGLVLAPPPGVNTLSRLTAKMRLSSALKSAEPPADDSLLPLYVESLQGDTLDAMARSRVCRAITYADGATKRYVASWIPYYIEAVCAFSDDPRCVLFVLALLYQGSIDPKSDLSFSEGVYSAALFFSAWEGNPYRVAFGLPSYPELRRGLAELYLANVNEVSQERTALVETVYGEITGRSDADAFEQERLDLARYLVRVHRADGRNDLFAQTLRDYVQQNRNRVGASKYEFDTDPLDDPEAILRGGSGNPEDDLRIARRYIEENRTFDSAACALFARCIRYAEAQGNGTETDFWTVKLALALIAVNRVDEDTREILKSATQMEPGDPLLELAFLYSYAKDGSHEIVSRDADIARRLERVVLEKSSLFKPIADRKRWDWNAMERALALSWGHRGRTDAPARSLYKQMVETNPEDRLLTILYARALAQANITDRSAIVAYENVMEMGKATDAIRRCLAIAYAKSGAAKDDAKRAVATRLWEEMYRTGMADDTDILTALADSYARNGQNNDVAIDLWEKAAKADPKNGRIRLLLGREMRQRGDTEEATRFLKEASKLLPDDFEVQYETALLLRERNDEAGAVRLLQKAITLPGGTTHKEAHFALAEAFIATEKRDDARLILEKIATELDPEHAPTLLQLAKLSLRYEDAGVKRAESLYAKAVHLAPSDPEAHRHLATLHEEQGRFSDAEAEWEKYLALTPPDAVSTRKLADLYLKRGDFVKAESALRQTVALGASDKKLFTLLGEVIMQAQKQRDGKRTHKTEKVPVLEEITPMPMTKQATRRFATATAASMPTATLPAAPAPTTFAPIAPANDLTPKRQTIVTQSTVPVEPSSAPTPNPDSPTAQNLTRSVGAAAIKAALRNRAARLAQVVQEEK